MSRRLLERSVNFVPWRMRRYIRDIPGIASLQRAFIHRFLSNSEFLHVINAGPAHGLRIKINLPRDKTLWTGTYEVKFAEELSARVRPGDIAYDIGAFRGFMSGVMALAGAKQVISFEPLEENLRQLQELALLNPELPLDVRVIAIGDQDGQAIFEQMSEPSMGKLSQSGFQSDVRGASRVSIAMRSVDSLVEHGEAPPPNVIKIDVEGAEGLVLDGAKRTLRKYQPIVLIEAHSRQLERKCKDELIGLGYHVSHLQSDSVRGNSGVSHLAARIVSQNDA